MCVYDKPFLSIDQQVQQLSQRGLAFPNRQAAAETLSKVGYYRLSAYWYPFRVINLDADQPRRELRLDEFQEGSSFDSVLALYEFDKHLRTAMMGPLELIEVSIRTRIALELGAIDPWAHRDPANFDGKFIEQRHWPNDDERPSKHEEWLARQDSRFNSSKEEFAQHFKSNYGQSSPPIWIAVEAWDFGTLSTLFAGLKHSDRNRIAQSFGLPPDKTMSSWIRTLNDMRNICAHHSRLWSRPLTAIPRKPTAGISVALDHVRGTLERTNRLYALLCILKVMLHHIDPTNEGIRTLLAVIPSFPRSDIIDIEQAGFPPEWEDFAFWTELHDG